MKYKISIGTECLVSTNKDKCYRNYVTTKELNLESKHFVNWEWSEEAGIKNLVFMFPRNNKIWIIKVDQRKVEITNGKSISTN